MSKLNAKGKNAQNIFAVAGKNNRELTVSQNGNIQFTKLEHQELYEVIVSTMFGKDSFYLSTNDMVSRARQLILNIVSKGDCDFIANLIIHAREEMNIRTMPIVATVMFADALRTHNVQYPQLRRLVCDVIQRADQVTDLYAYALHTFGNKNKVPMAIKRGVGDAFNKFNEYHFAKYNRNGEVKIRDVLRIVHPVAVNVEQGEIFKKIMDDCLKVPYTWETELSVNGQLPVNERKSKKQLWTELVSSGKMGYMALIRNLRNICDAGIDADVMRTHVCDVISDEKRVRVNRQLPVAYALALQALAEVNAPTALKSALNTALEYSVDNIPPLGDDVVLLVDSSGSMQGGYYYNDTITTMSPADYASIFAAMLVRANKGAYNVRVIYFDSTAKEIKVDPDVPVLTQAKRLRELSRGGATELGAAFKLMEQRGWKPDTLIVLSDMEVNHMDYHKTVRTNSMKDCVKVAVNFCGGNSTPLSEIDGWYQLSGWSDNMFKFIPAMREGVTVVETLSGPYRGSNK